MSHYDGGRATSVGTLPWTVTCEERCQIKADAFGSALQNSHRSQAWCFQHETTFAVNVPDCRFGWSLTPAVTLHLPELRCTPGIEHRAVRRAPYCGRWCYVCFDLTLYGQNGNMWSGGSVYKCLQMFVASYTKHTHTHTLATILKPSSFGCLDGTLKHMESFKSYLSIQHIPFFKKF